MRARSSGADHDAVGKLEVADRGALAQKFRVGGNHQIGGRIGFAHHPLDLVAGADRNGGFGDDDGETLQRRGDLARRRMNIAQIRVTVAAPRRRADRDEHRLGLADRRVRSVVKSSRPAAYAGDDQIVGPARRSGSRRVSGSRSCAHPCRRRSRDAEVGKAGARDEADIAGADHRDPHGIPLSARI